MHQKFHHWEGICVRRNGLQLVLILILVISLAMLAAAGLAMLTPENVVPAGPGDGDGGSVVASGRLPGYEDYPINDDPQSFYYLIGSNVVFNRPEAQGNLMIENTTGNVCQMQVTLELHDTGVVIYTSPVLEPDQHIERDKLDVTLEKGSYDVTAKILAPEAVARLKMPLLFLTAGKDTLVRNDAIARLCAMAPDARRVDFPESKHEIYRGEDATVQRWVQTVLDFLPA